MKLINRRYIFTNVKDTNFVDKGKFQIVLPELELGNHIIHRFFIKKCIIPYNWKRVTSTTKTITYIHQNGTNHTWTLTEGNPSLLDLLAELTSLFGNDLDYEFDRIQSRLIFHNHSQNQSFTLATTAYDMLGFSNSNTITVAANTSYTCPNPIDLRPNPIIEIRADISTAGHEIKVGDISNTNILCAIAMNVQPFSHKVWIDDNGLYFADLTNEHRAIMIELTTPDNERIVPQTYPYFIFGIDTYQDDEKSLLETQRESLKLQKYSLLMKRKK